MNKYHDQTYLKKIVKQINKEKDINAVIEFLREGYEYAKYEQSEINAYTPPEEINSRNQAVYYYEDLFEMLGVN